MDADGRPVFQGESELAEPPVDFAWVDFKRGVGAFDVTSETWTSLGTARKGEVEVTVHSEFMDKKRGTRQFLIRGSLPLSRDLYFAMNVDMDSRPQWDESTVSIKELSAKEPARGAGPCAGRERTLHWEVKYPWPLGRREYLLKQSVRTVMDGETEVRCIRGQSMPAKESAEVLPPTSGVTRIDDYRANTAVWDDRRRPGRCQFALLYFEDSKVSLPGWLMNQVVTSTMPSQFNTMVVEAQKYSNERLREVLGRYEIPIEEPEAVGSPNAPKQRQSDADAEGFYSASDDDGEDENSNLNERVNRSSESGGGPLKSAKAVVAAVLGSVQDASVSRRGQAGRPTARGAAHALLGKTQVDVAQEMEEGVLILNREERDLLLEMLAEMRARQHRYNWFFGCCPCRRRCFTAKDEESML